MCQRKLWFALQISRYKSNNRFVTDVKLVKIFLVRVISSCFVVGKLLSQPKQVNFLDTRGIKEL